MPTYDNPDLINENQTYLEYWCKSCHDYFKEIDLEDKQNSDKNKKKPSEPCIEKCRGFAPLIQKSVFLGSNRCRDSLIKISMLCREFEVTSLINDIEGMEKLFEKYSPVLGKAFEEKCFAQPRAC